MGSEKYIIHIGFSGFPRGGASYHRTRLTFKGLKNLGMRPLIINKISHHAPGDFKRTGRSESIPFVNTAYLTYRPNSFLKRNFNKLSGYFGEFVFLFRKRKQIDNAILYSNYFAELPYYWILSRIFRFKLVYQYVEFFSEIPGRDSLSTKLNDKLMDNYFYKFCDGVICISDFLIAHLKKKSKHKPFIKLPANCDYESFEKIQPNHAAPFMMYCGSIDYQAVIEFILNVFGSLKLNNKYNGNLLLVLGGNNQAVLDKFNEKLSANLYRDSIILKTNLLLKDIIPYYKAADMLWIPLRDSIQDIARFPHKVGEYTASKRPLVSTNVGEMKSYFKDGESAILADKYSEESYISKLSAMSLDKNTLDKIGINGHEIGLNYFEYNKQAVRLKEFIESL